MKGITSAILITALSTALSGCDRLQQASSSAASAVTQAGQAVQKQTRVNPADKMNGYLSVIELAGSISTGDANGNQQNHFLTHTLSRLEQSNDTIAEMSNAQGEPIRSKVFSMPNNGISVSLKVMSPISSDSVSNYAEAIKTLRAMQPAYPKADEIAGQLPAALQAAAQAHNKLVDYYKSEAYKLDDLAKAKTLHRDFLSAYAALAALNAKLSAEREIVYEQMHQQELAELRSSGQKALLSVFETHDAATALVEQMIDLHNKGQLARHPREQLSQQIDRLEQFAAQTEAMANDPAQLKTEDLKQYELENLARETRMLIVQARLLERSLGKSGQALQYLERMDQIRGTIINHYNQIVS
ncbi:DUF3829 domain-containing protein [Chitinilyticum aquatile]|uniref:DUF3829 domain-containing protein n=1 Tax=Chitinilyticum aquatile TaxID=362520 RepID=UPI000414F626|nr:DUF3829 domain-containing protein [Chitinilyticum aquatile]